MGAAVVSLTVNGFGCWGANDVRLCRDKSPQKRSQGLLALHTHSADSLAKQGKCGITRREWLALGVCMTENVFAGSLTWDKQQRRADAAQEENPIQSQDGDAETTDASGEGKSDLPLSGLLSVFDPNVKTKSGRLVPKGYLKSARKVVKTLKESLKEESSKESDVRRSADQAKEAIRDYLSNWRGQKAVESEDSYKALEGVIRILGGFYAKEGPRAVLPSTVKSEILTNLEVADAAL